MSGGLRTSLAQVGIAPLLSSKVIILTSKPGFNESNVGPRLLAIHLAISAALHPMQLNGQRGIYPFIGSLPVVTAQKSIFSFLYS